MKVFFPRDAKKCVVDMGEGVNRENLSLKHYPFSKDIFLKSNLVCFSAYSYFENNS